MTGLPAAPWGELLALAEDEPGERALLERLLDLWCATHGARAAALYADRRSGTGDGGGRIEQIAAVGRGLPESIAEESLRGAEPGRLRLPGGWLLFSPPGSAGFAADNDPLPLLLASALKSARLRQDLKEQQFLVNYRVVELEALYDVGLAVAATLDLDRVSEEILLRAVSLLDARRGALYILEEGRYRLDRTFGGEAGRWFAMDEPALAAFLGGGDAAPADLLPGARYLLGVPILFESSRRGMLVMGDKESRRGVGPFLPGDRRTLGLFANQAAIALENARLHLRALEQERLEGEMHVAAEIQRRILPKGAPLVPGFHLVGWNRPAREVGGDYYDMFPTRGGRIGLVVGDVSGKGIPAALMVSTLHSALRLLLDQTEFGPALLERLNRHILESSTPNKFITMLIAELNPRISGLRYINAGHNSGFLLRAGSPVVDELPSGGVPLGLLPGSRYPMRELTLEPGDLLCIYSDGITEAESMAEEELGNDRLIDVLRRHREAPVEAILDAIRREVGEFTQGRPQGDDQTLLLLRRDGG